MTAARVIATKCRGVALIILLGMSVIVAVSVSVRAAEPAEASSSSNPACVQATAAHPPAAASKATTPSAAKPAVATPAAKPIVPLQANGLIARSLRQIGLWAAGLGNQFNEAGRSLVALIKLFERSGGHIANASDRQLLLRAGGALAAVFAAGLVLEWLLHFALKRPLRALVAKANAVEERDRTREARDRAVSARHAQASRTEDKGAEQAKTEAGVQPPSRDVALVHTNEHGVDQVEPVRVGAKNSAAGSQADPAQQETSTPSASSKHADQSRPARYLNTLHHLLFATVALLINLVPLAMFFIVSGLVLRAVGGDDDRIHAMVSSFIDAYVSMRITMAILRLLVSPEGPGLCVLRVSHQTTRTVLWWMRGIVFLAAFGMAVGDALQTLGGGAESRMAFIKLVSLFVHVGAVILILRLRHPVARAIAAAPNAHGPLAGARNWLARVWALFAVVFVLGVWVVWALGVEDGFPKLIHFIGISAGILIVARVLTILVQGGLGRLFHHDGDVGTDVHDARSRLARRYYPIINGLVSFFITVFTLIALCQAWGLDSVGWFAHSAVGHSLASASMTILVATIIAIVVWEAASLSIERRIALWTEHGDLMRAARLRTLLPMMRTTLLIVVVLVVGLTALNEIGINTTPLLASASIVGVALGFGSQKLVQDFITGIFLLMENAMQVGDWVTVAGVSGTVEYLSVRTVRLRGGDGSLYTVPFSSVTTVNNINRGIGNASMSVSVAYGVDVERAIEELKKIGKDLRADPAFQKSILKDLEIWGVDSVDGSKVTIVGQMQCNDSGRWGVQRELNRRIMKRFRDVGIEIANPRVSYLFMEQDAKPANPGPAK